VDESIVVSKGVFAEADEEDADADATIDAVMREMTKSGKGNDFGATKAMVTMCLVDGEKKRKVECYGMFFSSFD